MKFNRRAKLDASQVSDQRGRGKTGAAAAGGLGGLGIIGVIIMMFLGGGGDGGAGGLGLGGQTGGDTANAQPSEADEANIGQTCRTGADANSNDDCRLVATINSIQSFWITTFDGADLTYEVVVTNWFTDDVNTGGCGSATSAVDPFYCPADKEVYVDLGFFDDLVRRFGANRGDFAEAYILGREYGHHVQNLLGISSRVQRGESGPESDAVRLELQADCFADAWANHATTTPDESGQPYILELSQQDVRDALSAVAAVGDDRIQKNATGRVDPHSFTHGTSEQREDWFMRGFRTGDVNECDTFAASDL
ncbi:MAG: putative metalloprotease [Candidatus Poriferisodalaceae bacterium]|jgi:predicted metalloprotease